LPPCRVSANRELLRDGLLLLIELRGRDASDRHRIQEAIGRIGYRGGRQLTFVPRKATPNSNSHTATDDGKGVLHGANQTALDKNRELREAQERNNQTPVAATTSSAAREAQRVNKARQVRSFIR
jgi:hypothetical protein